MNTNTRFAASNATTRRQSNSGAPAGSRAGNYHPHSAAATRSPVPAFTSTATGANSPGLESLEALGVPLTATIPLIDPTGFGGLIQVPVTRTMETKGRMEFFKGILRKEVSLCCLYQRDRCHAAEKCHQIHVDNMFIKNVRAQNAHVISCCRACKDTASLSPTAVTFFATHCENGASIKIVAPDGRYSLVQAENVAITIGLTQHAEQMRGATTLTSIPAKKMCRLHLRGACKYGKDCKNVHLCSKLGEAILVPTQSPAPSERSVCSSASTSRSPTPTPVPTTTTAARPVAGIMDRNGSPAPCVVVGATLAAPKTAERRNSTSSSSSAHSQVTTSPGSIVSCDAPKDYFSEQRFQTPGSLSRSGSTGPVPEEDALSTESDATSATEQKKRRLSFSEVDLSNISFMENSVAVDNLCFDPTMALWDDVPAHQPKKLSAEWFDDVQCGCSSTTSQKSQTPTPLKVFW